MQSFMVREKDEEEAVDDLMQHIWNDIEYWNKYDGNDQDKLEGLAFSFLTMLDGCDGTGYDIKPLVSKLEDAFKFGETSIYKKDIGNLHEACFELHDRFYEYAREKGIYKNGQFVGEFNK